MPGSKPRPILPAAVDISRPLQSDPDGPSRKRQVMPRPPNVAYACSQCRKTKAKCSGARPKCARCLTRKLECEYDDDIGRLSVGDLRKRYREVLATQDNLQTLLSCLAKRSEIEAINILQRLRTTDDPLALVELLKHGDLLIQQRTTSVLSNECEELWQIEQEALAGSHIKVPALPWTAIAGDGIVSELISSFIALEHTFLFSFIDRDAFLEDMRHSTPDKAKHCSYLLVNAMCSLRSHTCKNTKRYCEVKGIDVRKIFLDEANKLFYLEAGKVSLPTVQALIVMYMCCAGMGRDRAGKMFRIVAYDMLKQLRLQHTHELAALEPGNQEYRRVSEIASRASWGIYCFESISSFAYLHPSLIIRPSCPRTFLQRPIEKNRPDELTPDELRSHLMLDAMCDLSIIYNEGMSHNLASKYDLGSELDLHRRSQLLSRVRSWRMGLAAELHLATNPTMAVYCLRSYEDQVIMSIVRDLDENTNLPGNDLVVRDIVISCCLRSIVGLSQFGDECSVGLYSSHVIYPLYNSALALLMHLQHPSSHEYFSHTCRQLSLLAKDFPFNAFLMQGLRVLADEIDVSIPDLAIPYFESLQFTEEELRDVPIAFVIPARDGVRERLIGAEGNKSPGLELGQLIMKWSQSLTASGAESTEMEP